MHFIATVYCFHELSENIVSDRNSQFISMLWRTISKKLKMILKSFFTFHSQINNQTKIANVFLKQYFQVFTNFMQNDWMSWLSLTEFAYNNQVNNSTNISLFFVNYDFHLKMSIKSFFSCLSQIFKIFWEEFFNANSIADKFQKILNFVKSNIILAQKIQEKYINQYWFITSKYKMKE